jgi:hypothetical protein
MGSMFSYSKTAMERAMKVRGHFAGDGEKDHVIAGSRKNVGATGCGRLTKTRHFICYEKGPFLMS